MKKIFLMCVFAGFTAFAAFAQTEPTAAATTDNKSAKKEGCTKVCTPEEKAACMTKMAGTKGTCCVSKASGTAMAAKSDKAATASTKKVATTSGNK